MTLKKLLIIGVFFLVGSMYAQDTKGPKVIITGEFLGKTIPLRDMPNIYEMKEAGFENIKEIKQRFDPTQPNMVSNTNALPLDGEDPVRQTEQGTRQLLSTVQNFEGASVSEGQAVPPDPSGAVGPNHYVHAVNVVVKIFDKTGVLLTGPTSLGSFLGNGTSNGDPIVMYDQLADRFFVSQFQISNNALIVGVSVSPDPTGSYNVYSFPLDSFPDYPHYSIWPNAYFMTANKFNGNTTYALDRQALLNGDSDPTIVGFDLPQVVRNPAAVFSPEPANLVGTDFDAGTPGYIVYLQDDSWSGVSFDHLKIWEIDVDFDTPANSTVSTNPLELPTAPFDSFLRPFGSGDINQPNVSQRIDAISGVISFAANYRKFATHNSWLITMNADVGGITPGIRWIELRNDSTNDWSIYQEGTYAPADGESRFMSSGAMDINGNIGMAYNLASENTFASIKFTGRFDGDALGEMTFPESTIWDGTSSQSNTNRFGDYSHLTMDPDGVTFWHTSEYFQGTNNWRTRIAAFRLNSGLTSDLGVSSFVTPTESGDLSNAETVTVNVYNFGNDAQTNFEMQLSVDGTVVATESYTGTLDPLSGDTFTFAQTVDLSTPQTSYEIEARTVLTGDENTPNDPFVLVIENTTLSVNDVEFNNGTFNVIPVDAKQFDISFTTTQEYGAIDYSVYNTIGQKVIMGDLEQEGLEYTGRLDLSPVVKGVYFVVLTNGKFQATKRIILTK